MKHTRILERAATALAIAAIATGVGGVVWRPAPDAFAPEAIVAAAGRFESAVALRRDTRRDDQFDAIVGSLAAGVRGGHGELARAVERVRSAREREREAGVRGDEVDAALGGLGLSLGRESAVAEGSRGSSPIATLACVSLVAAAAVLGSLARRQRRREIEALKAALDVARRGSGLVRTSCAAPVAMAPTVALPAQERAAAVEHATDPTPFGTLLEVVAVDDEPTGDQGLAISGV